MAETTQKTAYDGMPEFIRNAIDAGIKKATEEELENAKKRIDERKSHIIAGVLLHVQEQINFHNNGTTLNINIKLTK